MHTGSLEIMEPTPALGSAAPASGHQGEDPLPLPSAARGLLACALRTVTLLATHRIRQPSRHLGQRIRFADGTESTVYRETVIHRDPPLDPAVLVVSFRLRWVHGAWMHTVFRWESELNTILFAGFPGLVSKLWLRQDQNDVYRGFYQWDGAERAVAYVGALWWVLALVSERDSIHYAVLPGLDRDQVLTDPGLVDGLAASPGGWWRPTDEHPGVRT